MALDWLTVKNKVTKSDIYIYGEIANDKIWDEDVTPCEIKEELMRLKANTKVTLHINSPGGSVFAGMTIYNTLSVLAQHVTARIEGLAASIASVVAMAANTVYIPDTAMIMLHNPSGVARGESDEMRKTAELLDTVKGIIISVYEKKTGLPYKQLSDMMDAETWLTGQEAIPLNFSDGAGTDNIVNIARKANGSVIFNGLAVDVSKFKAFPKSNQKKVDKRKVTLLRDRFNVLKNKT